MSQIKLFSARACPFAHRTRLVLAEKSIPFELIEIDLQYKPAWFDAKLSGYGKVPALEHAGQHIWESAIVNEYIEEVFPEPRLLPAEPAQRAAARIWIDYANTRFAPAFGRLLRATNSAEEGAARQELVQSRFCRSTSTRRHRATVQRRAVLLGRCAELGRLRVLSVVRALGRTGTLSRSSRVTRVAPLDGLGRALARAAVGPQAREPHGVLHPALRAGGCTRAEGSAAWPRDAGLPGAEHGLDSAA